MAVSAEDFVDKLQEDCLEHPAMKHSYLKRFENREIRIKLRFLLSSIIAFHVISPDTWLRW